VYQVFSYPIQGTESQDTPLANQSLFVNHYVDITDSRELYLRVLQNEKISAIGLLAGNIAHELNNPLTGIKSLAQVLKAEIAVDHNKLSPADEKNSSQSIRDLGEIEKSAARCQKIIHNLLDFSSAEEGNIQTIAFDEVIEKTLPMLKSVTRYFETSLSLNSRGALVAIEPHLIQQVIFNIVNNACQAMDKRGKISIHSSLENEAWATLQISDTGPGIPEEIQAKIFEPFFTTKKEGVGTGLGLSMSKQVLDRYHGELAFESKLGAGTTFKIRLPILKITN
jgi:signal transduction histidine kinase